MTWVRLTACRQWPTIGMLAALLGCAWLATYLGVWEQISFRYGSPGTLDFIQYWSAFDALTQGRNPYNPQILTSIQRGLGHDGTLAVLPVMMWNPPWVLVMLAPFLWLPFSLSALVWMLGNFGLWLGTGILAWRAACETEPKPVALGLALAFFYPAWSTVVWGQLSLLLALGVAGLYWALINQRGGWAAIFLVLLSVKPHLFFLLLFAVGWHLIGKRRWDVFIFCALLLVLLIALVAVIDSRMFGWWLIGLGGHGDDASVITVLEWKSANLPTLIRSLSLEMWGHLPIWPMYGVPVLSAAVLLGLLVGGRLKLNWRRHYVPLLALSLFLSPYGWQYDHVVLILGQIVLVAYALAPTVTPPIRVKVFSALALLQVIGIAQGFTPWQTQDYFAWMPAAFLLVWLWALKLLWPVLSRACGERSVARTADIDSAGERSDSRVASPAAQ